MIGQISGSARDCATGGKHSFPLELEQCFRVPG
jgi:hypothetical protein